MSRIDELMELAEKYQRESNAYAQPDRIKAAKSALRAAIEEYGNKQYALGAREAVAPKGEPVVPYAWHYWNNGGATVYHRGPSKWLDADMEAARKFPAAHHCIPLYTHPAPQPEPVLTDDEMSPTAGVLYAAQAGERT